MQLLTCRYTAENLASTVSQWRNLQLTAEVRQLQKKTCVLKLVCHQLTDNHTNSQLSRMIQKQNSQNVKYIPQAVSRRYPVLIMHERCYRCSPAIYFHFLMISWIHVRCLSQQLNMVHTEPDQVTDNACTVLKNKCHWTVHKFRD